ncbi:hypothetical protein PL75_00650 [Neisseria arctica]|uniref:Extradiol ring-cleavage dioxygenase class III enzyme subunit B domain-containing protein n=1 Tax=Neisseria arctica TaxID=1470200 RepID=A0A0J0YUV7_9NEIS|nr:4,5-DOPA dioxygenase extradiol [Neisseria arctica]KLT73880.1 hypothetical protein PL75_00650 [Neisseria arctica]
MKLPAIFFGHGSPMNALQENAYSASWARVGQGLRRHYGGGIRAVLAVSAHWCTEGLAVTASERPHTVHDFGGFPRALFDVRYPAPGSPELASEVAVLLGTERVRADFGQGLDHGVWSVLRHVFPEADVPVVQLGLDMNLDARGHFELGQRLAVLRERSVLIIASGNIVHNLRMMDWRESETADEPYPWAESVRKQVNGWLENHDVAALVDENAYSGDFALAVPTPEHFWPLLYIAAVRQAGEDLVFFNDEIIGKSLSMTSVLIGGGLSQFV